MTILGLTLRHFMSDVGFALAMAAIAAPIAVLFWFGCRDNFGWGPRDDREDRR